MNWRRIDTQRAHCEWSWVRNDIRNVGGKRYAVDRYRL